MDLGQGEAGAEGVGQVPEPVGVGDAQLAAQRVQFFSGERPAIVFRRAEEPAFEAVGADFQGAHRLLQAFLEGPADGHDLPHRLHLGGQGGVGLGEFLEGEARDLGDHVVDGRLEGGGGLAGDVVGDLVEGVADGELGGDLGDGEAGRLGGQRRGAGDAGVHLDDHQPAVRGVDAELDVGTAGLDADLADDLDRGVAQDLVFLVGQGLRRGDGDGVAGMDAHRVEVLDGADDDDVVGQVAHHLQLELLPADDRLLHQDLAGRRGVDAGDGHGLVLFAVVGDAAAGAAEGEGGADDRREADVLDDVHRLLVVVGQAAARHGEADAFHRLLEQGAVLGLLDGRELGADQLDAVLLQGAVLGHRHRGLSAVWPPRVGSSASGRSFSMIRASTSGRDRLDVGAVGEVRVGHDRGRVGVEQDDLVALLLQRLAGLGAGVVEFAGLADDDRAGADDQDLLDVGTFGHF